MNDSGSSTDGPSDSKSLTVTVVSGPTCTLTHSNDYALDGVTKLPVTLTWTSANADYANVQYTYGNTAISPALLPSVLPAGSMVVNNYSIVEYMFTFHSAGGAKACTAKLWSKG
jgi:hypothetical protein